MSKRIERGAVIILERFTLTELARYLSVDQAVNDLGVRAFTVYKAIKERTPVYDCYWLYESQLMHWVPKYTIWRRVRGNKMPEKIKELIEKMV